MKKIQQYWPIGVVIGIVIALLGLQLYIDMRGDERRQNGVTNVPGDENQLGTSVQLETSTSTGTSSDPQEQTQPVTMLKRQDVVVGTGAEAISGKTVTVHYSGRFINGQEFDSSVRRGTPFTFTLGGGQVIKGWDQGVQGMKVGGKRTLAVPPSLGYGANDYGPIPGNSTLIFDIELLKVE